MLEVESEECAWRMVKKSCALVKNGCAVVKKSLRSGEERPTARGTMEASPSRESGNSEPGTGDISIASVWSRYAAKALV